MADRLLITQSLLSAWNYTFDCMEGYEEDAMSDFLKSLRREPKEQTDAMLLGCTFEDEVYKVALGETRETPHPKWENGIQAVATHIMDAAVQVKCYADFSICGQDFLLFGIMDAIKAGHIYDVKFTTKSLGSGDFYGKYLNSPQHPAYLYAVPEAKDFTYLVSDGDELYTETYTREMTRPFPEIVEDFVRWLKSMQLYDEYVEHWRSL